MRVIHALDAMAKEAAAAARKGLTVGLVPTMGALHDGHASLMRRARAENGKVVVSIYVNPGQFMPGEDYDRYPRALKEDAALARREGADIVFAPDNASMYPANFQTSVMVEKLSGPLEGMSRGRGHFAGVATVVLKLFNIVRPDTAYFGQKDAQQALLLQRMTDDLNLPVRLVLCPTVREADGLALSSRNRYLSKKDRQRAIALRRALLLGRGLIRDGQRDADALATAMAESILSEEDVELDYLEIVNPATLEPVKQITSTVLVAGAIGLSGTRLLDNIIVGPDGPFED